MAKKIINPNVTNYETSCGECGTRFTYEVEDIIRNHHGLPHRFVTCPRDQCVAQCAHFEGNRI